jgi:hypothetical protein
MRNSSTMAHAGISLEEIHTWTIERINSRIEELKDEMINPPAHSIHMLVEKVFPKFDKLWDIEFELSKLFNELTKTSISQPLWEIGLFLYHRDSPIDLDHYSMKDLIVNIGILNALDVEYEFNLIRRETVYHEH